MKLTALALVGIIALIAFSGCTLASDSSVQDSINSEAEAMNSMINVSNDIEDVGSAFDDIDALLG